MWRSKTTRPGYVDKKKENLGRIEEAKTETETESEDPKTESESEPDQQQSEQMRAATERLGKISEITPETNETDTEESETEPECNTNESESDSEPDTDAEVINEDNPRAVIVKIDDPGKDVVTPEVIYRLNENTEKLAIRGKSIFLDLLINKTPVEVELDTGSPISIMNEELLHQIPGARTKPNTGSRCFTDFNNQVVRIEKTAKLTTKFRETTSKVKWWIVKHQCKPIIGTNNMESLGLFVGYKPTKAEKPGVNNVNRIANLNEITELESILKNKYFKLFKH